jgi:hypothetical protein
MFERIAIRRRSAASLGHPVDLGVLAESLVYYGEVRLIANHAVLKALLDTATPDVVIDLLEDGFLKIAYEADDVAIQTSNSGTSSELHEPIYFSLPHLELQEYLPTLLLERLGKPGKARRMAQRMSRKIEIIRHDKQITSAAREDLLNSAYVGSAVRTLLARYAPEYGGGTNLTTRSSGERLRVETDIDFSAANMAYHRRVSPKHSSLSPSYLLAHLVSVKADITFAARYGSEIATDDVNALIVREHLTKVVGELWPTAPEVSRFQEYVLGDGKAIGEAVREGRQTLRDVQRLILHAGQFKGWLQQPDVGRDVLKAYVRELSSTHWFDELPTKIMRWFVFTGAGVVADALGSGGVGTAIGVTVSAADTFLLERILKGWRPTQFVSELRAFMTAAKQGSGPRY